MGVARLSRGSRWRARALTSVLVRVLDSTAENYPPINECIEAKVLPELVKLLRRDDHPLLQVWAVDAR